MRIFKRNLALVLAFVMAMSLTVGAMGVEDYKDANDINFVEAVDVLTEMGILEGTDGVFNATKTLKRAEAAKIISYMMLGKKSADNLKAATAPFADVPATHWAAGYIANCANEGILGGYGNGNFGPEDVLTATQFAKMLLCAVGYGVNGEFSGSNWDVEVNKLALAQGVYENNLGVDFNEGCTREEAALYAFNTMMNIETVKYSESFGTYYVGNSIFAGEGKGTTLNEECGYNFTVAEDQEDDFGREGYAWKNGKGKIVTGLYGNEALAVYTTAIDADDVHDVLDLEKNETKVLEVMEDGKEAADFTAKNNDKTAIGGNGTLVEVYEDKIVVINTYLATVTADAEDGVVKTTRGEFETEAEYEKDDVVIVTIADDEIQTMAIAETVEGELTGSNFSKKWVEIDDEKIHFAANHEIKKADIVDGEVSVTIDNYGYAMAIDTIEEDEEEVTSENYIIITASKVKEDIDWTNDEKSATAQVKVTYVDGSESEILDLHIELNDDDEPCFMLDGKLVEVSAKAIKDLEDEVLGFYEEANGIALMNLVDGETAYNNGEYKVVVDEKTTMTVAGDKYKLNNKSEIVVIEDGEVETNKGYKYDLDVTAEYVLVLEKNGVVVTMYVIGEANAVVDEDTVIAWYNKGDYNLKNVKDNEYEIGLYIDGEYTDEYKFDGASIEALESGLYVVETDNEGFVKLTAAKDGTDYTAATVASVEDDEFNYIVVGTERVYIADEVVVYDVTEEAMAEADVEILSANDKIAYIVDDNGDISVIYVLVDAE